MKISTSVYVEDQDKALRFYKYWALPRNRFQPGALSLADRGPPRSRTALSYSWR
jgi:hypothetical protein